MNDSENDNTFVYLIKRKFGEEFLNMPQDSGYRGKRLCLDETQEATASTVPNDVSVMTSSLNDLDRSIEAKKQAAELTHAKSKIVQLESKLSNSAMLLKKSRIDHDNELAKLRLDMQVLCDDKGTLSHQISQACKREQALAEELASIRETAVKDKLAYEERILTLQRERNLSELRHGQAVEEQVQKVTDIRSKLIHEEAAKKMVETELNEMKEQYTWQTRKLKDLQVRQREQEAESQDRLAVAERRLRELSDQLAAQSEDRSRVAAACSDLEQLTKWRTENEMLREENRRLRDTEENVHLLKEMFEGAQQKLQRYENRLQQTAQLEADNEALKLRVSALESDEAADNSNLIRRSSLVSKQIAEFQCKEVLHLAAEGDLKASLHIYKEKLRAAESELRRLRVQCSDCTNTTLQQDELIKRLQRKLLLVSQERDAHQRALEALDGGLTVDVATVANSKLALAEQAAKNLRTFSESLQEGLSKKTEDLLACQRRCAELDEQLKALAASPSSSQELVSERPKDAEADADRKTTAHLRSEIEELHKAIEVLSNEKSILEMRIEQRQMQGEYDPTKTKVLHMRMNPLSRVQKQHSTERERLRADNERLRERLRTVEDAMAAGERVHDLTSVIEQRLQDPEYCNLQEVKSQLAASESKCQRMSERFKQAATDFREAVYRLLGYRIDMHATEQFQLMSQYAESPNDYLVFQHKRERNTIELLENDYAISLRDLTEQHLRRNGIPMFLSALTMELFSRQTICDNSTV